MNEETVRALETDRVIDIATTGRKSGEPRRKEIWFANIDGSLYITGAPGKRSWYATCWPIPTSKHEVGGGADSSLSRPKGGGGG